MTIMGTPASSKLAIKGVVSPPTAPGVVGRVVNIEMFRRFYLEYPQLVPDQISDAPRRKLEGGGDVFPSASKTRLAPKSGKNKKGEA